MTHISEMEASKTDSMKSDADIAMKEDTNDSDNNIARLHIDENITGVHDTASYQPIEYIPPIDTHTDTYHEHVANKHDENIRTYSKDAADVCASTACITIEGQNASASIEHTNIHQDIRPIDSSVLHKGHITQDLTHTIEHSSKDVTLYTSGEHTSTKIHDEKDTALLHSPQKEIDEEIPYHTPIIIEHTKDSPCKSVGVKSDVQDVFQSPAHRTQNIQEMSHKISHIIKENKTSSIQQSFSQKREVDRDDSIERKHDVQTGSVLPVSHKIHAEQDVNPYIPNKDLSPYDLQKQTESNTPFNAIKAPVGLPEVKGYSSRDPRLHALAERTHMQENIASRKPTQIQEADLVQQDLSTRQDAISHTSGTDRHDRPYYVEHKTYAKAKTDNFEPKSDHIEHVSKDRKDVSAGHKKSDTDTITFKTPIAPEDPHHIRHKMPERDTYPSHKDDTLNTMSFKDPNPGHVATYATVGQKKHYEDASQYVPFGYMGHKDVSPYPSSHKPIADSSYSGLERKQELDANYAPIKQIEQYPNIHSIEQKKQAKTTPYHNVSHPGLLDPDLYHAPVAYEPSAYPMGQTGHVEHDPNYPMGHPRHIEHDPYSFGHMAPMETLYNPFDHYAFDQEPFGYMGHLGDTKHVEQDVRDTSVSYDVGHMDTFQAMEQSRHVLEADTETRTDTQVHETSPTHMLL